MASEVTIPRETLDRAKQKTAEVIGVCNAMLSKAIDRGDLPYAAALSSLLDALNESLSALSALDAVGGEKVEGGIVKAWRGRTCRGCFYRRFESGVMQRCCTAVNQPWGESCANISPELHEEIPISDLPA